MIRSLLIFLFIAISFSAYPKQNISLVISPDECVLSVSKTGYHFTRQSNHWALHQILVSSIPVMQPLSRNNAFFNGSGEANELLIKKQNTEEIELCLKDLRFAGSGINVIYSVRSDDLLPRVKVRYEGTSGEITAVLRSVAVSEKLHGAWVTRGETRTDAENAEVFIDGSGPFVFGHSQLGNADIDYVWQAIVNPNVPRKRTEQKTNTYFRSGQTTATDGSFAFWQLRMGVGEPKEFSLITDKDLGGRIHSVCEKYYADVVDSQFDLQTLDMGYDAKNAVWKMPVRLSGPECFTPGYGWVMQEYYPGWTWKAGDAIQNHSQYPYGTDAGIQTAALMAFEGFATKRDWEKNFGQYVLSQMPLWSDDSASYFVKRPGGYTRWAYSNDYTFRFPMMEGGSWGPSEQLYLMSKISGDKELKEKAISLMLHDVNVKLDQKKMIFYPCWNANKGKMTDHRDDWNITTGLGYCAVVAAECLYPETKEKRYLEMADQITDWLASFWTPERKMNFLHENINTIHLYEGWLVKAMVQRYERSHDVQFLNIAKDLTWCLIMTNCITNHHYPDNKPLFGITCVGVRGCVDYDCAPNLCQEKDQAFVEMMGSLMPYIKGPAYSRYFAMQACNLPRDRWTQAFDVQDQRDLNLRTNYDNWARGMANLSYGLNYSNDPFVKVFEGKVLQRDLSIQTSRDMLIINPLRLDKEIKLTIPYLDEGIYSLLLDGVPIGEKSNKELENGIQVKVSANNTQRMMVVQRKALPQKFPELKYDQSNTYLSDLEVFDMQRGVGNPSPVFVKDQTFAGKPLMVNQQIHQKGLGLAANTVLFYDLKGQYESFSSLLAMDDYTRTLHNPDPSVFVTIFADGKLIWQSGAFETKHQPESIRCNIKGAKMLSIRISGNWDNNGDLKNDFVNLIDAELSGRTLTKNKSL